MRSRASISMSGLRKFEGFHTYIVQQAWTRPGVSKLHTECISIMLSTQPRKTISMVEWGGNIDRDNLGPVGNLVACGSIVLPNPKT